MRTVIAILLMFTLVACKTPMKLEQSSQLSIVDKTEAKKEENTAKTENKNVAESVNSIINTSEGIEFHKVNYDTDKPVDPNTGKPPVKSELTGKKTVNTTENKQENKQELSSANELATITDNSNYNIKVKEKDNLVKKPQYNVTKNIAISLFLTISIIIVLWLLTKKKGWMSKILNLFK